MDPVNPTSSETTAPATPTPAAAPAPQPSQAATPTPTPTPAAPVQTESDRYKAVYRELEARAKGETPAATPASGQAPAPTGQAPQPGQQTTNGQPAADDAADPFAVLKPEEARALKRLQWKPETLALIPPANRTAIARQAMQSISEADRQFQRARNGQPPVPEAGDGQQGDQVKPGEQQPPAPATQAQTQQPKTGEPAASNPAGPAAGSVQADDRPMLLRDFQPYSMDDATYRNLEEIGGRDLADTVKGQLQAAVSHTLQAFKPFETMLLNSVSYMEQREFQDALSSLKSQRGYENLGDEEVRAIREKAEHLRRSAADPLAYRYDQAVKDAAATLFQIDNKLAAQANLLDRRSQTLRNTGDPGRSGQPAQPAAMNDTEMMHRVYRYMETHPGVDPRDARRAVESGAA